MLFEAPANLDRGLPIELRWKLFEQITTGVVAIHNEVIHTVVLSARAPSVP